MIDIEAVNREDGLVIASDGTFGHVTSWHDEDGNECSPVVAVRAVAHVGCKWVTIDLSRFITASLH